MQFGQQTEVLCNFDKTSWKYEVKILKLTVFSGSKRERKKKKI